MKTPETPRDFAPDSAAEPLWQTRRALTRSLLAIALLCVPLFFFRLGAWGLFDADEGRYAEIPRAMLSRGDFVTPMLNGVKFFDKPPLLYWLSALCFQIFGVNEFAARLIPALSATLAVFGTYALGRRMFGARAGLFSAAILATTVGWPIMGRAVLTDMLVSSLTFLAIAFWWIGRNQEDKRAAFWLFFGFWTALALGVLAKGPVSVVITFGTIGTYLIFCGEWAALKKMRWIPGLLWGFLLAAPWFVVVQQRNPEYFKAFWIDQNFGRFMGILAEQDHANGPFYFVEFLPILFLPWTIFAVPALFIGWKRIFKARNLRSEKERALMYLICGGAFTTLFFSGSSSKLVTYILPVVPMMAIALGGYFDWILRREKPTRAPRNAAFVLALLCLVGGAAGLIFAPPALQKIGVSASSASLVSAAMLLWGAALIFCGIKQNLKAIIAATACGFATIFALATGLVMDIAPALTTPHLVKYIQPGLDVGGEIVSIGFTQSLSFYTGRRIAMVDRPDELRSAIEHLSSSERNRWFLQSEAELKPYFGKKPPVYIVLRSSRKKSETERQKIDALGGDFSPVTRNSRFTILGNEAARRVTPPDLENLRAP
ncbi:4-amino-4-deoxy-L-arabinose transferase [Abditibacterium utsteinense]|uniref:4-amino-4-deoxy-L-arabinose transferase n=1 Tax=Abditibacterium utsteinense TaxID=1960156 RepID=A0A2S8SSN9_9BACT|nr:glycosyltransferase family 39 protein [Abditibacterium utsteinense]PQV63820.1 4-amino-4-deoxy-L-arabinose transferase [Abditibacterium utsteinense]